jgi:hypothetical protein
MFFWIQTCCWAKAAPILIETLEFFFSFFWFQICYWAKAALASFEISKLFFFILSDPNLLLGQGCFSVD